MKALTQEQVGKLRILGSGAIVLAPGRRDWNPLLKRGLVEQAMPDNGSRFLPPLRITAEGFRALADALERDGHPELPKGLSQRQKPPHVEEFEQRIAELKEKAWAAEREATLIRHKLRSAQRALSGEW